MLRPDRLDIPRRWKRPRRIFVNSMSDLFHELVPVDFIERVYDVMAQAVRHTFQILTKRPERMSEFFAEAEDTPEVPPEGRAFLRPPLPNVWLGTSIENQRHAYRADILRGVPAFVRFISAEPLLGPLELDLAGIDWLIVGGESGPHHRPCDPAWVKSLRDQAVEQGVAFFFKQWGGRTPKAGGRLLDGVEWSQMPGAAR